jgi:hypothetical protein
MLRAIPISGGAFLSGSKKAALWWKMPKIIQKRLLFRIKRMAKKLTKTINGEICVLAKWTSSCTGCTNSEDGHLIGEYPFDNKANCFIGSGCSECGYTGKRRQEHWVPENLTADVDS